MIRLTAMAAIGTLRCEAKTTMFQYDLLARARQRDLLREAERARLRRLARDGRRGQGTRPERKLPVVGGRP